MMTLKEQISEDRKQAMINRETEKRTTLTTLVGEIDRITIMKDGTLVPVKNPSDELIIPVIKKMVKDNVTTNCVAENQYLTIYLPELMSEEEVGNVVKTFITKNELNTPKSMGVVMSFLKNKYAGLYDGKMASEIVKTELLNGN